VVYYNSRVHGMKSHLYARAQVESLLDGELGKLSDTLLDSPYSEEMAESMTRYAGAEAVEDAVSRNLVHTFQKLSKAATGDMKSAVDIFLMRWDLLAVKSLLRCRHHNIQGDAASMWLVPGPTLNVAVMKELAEAESMEGLANALVAWNRKLCKGLLAALPKYQEHHDLALLEEALDRGYFTANAKALQQAEDEFSADLRDLLKSEIDRINLRVVFQFLVAQGDREQALARMLSGGFITLDTLQGMLGAGSVDAALEKLNGTRYQSAATDLVDHVKSGRLAVVERHFERTIIRQVRKLALHNVFGLGVMMHFVWLKHCEVVNLRLIARVLSGHLPKAKAQEELFFA
jgi:vacuolar-type H+-ATPase subunit C/Vma6